jgi:hypothetical protein
MTGSTARIANQLTRPSEKLQRLIESNASLWAAEAEIVQSYWDSPVRTRETDILWLRRQMYKEFWDGFFPPYDSVISRMDQLETRVSRNDFLDAAETMYEEFVHYCLFAEVHDKLSIGDGPLIDPQQLRITGDWKENKDLMNLRAEHKQRHPALGPRSHYFTEGGYCTLYSEGMKLKGRGGIDDMIAHACVRVYDDEFDHMLKGIAGMDDNVSEDECRLLEELTAEQMRYRLYMRNSQFSFPVSAQRVEELCAGVSDPLEFDYARAGFAI